MKNRIVPGLFALLILQLVIAAGMTLMRGGNGENGPQTALASIMTDAVERVLLDDGDNRIVLEKSADGWVLAEESRVPADAARIDALFRRIGGITPGFPVARKANSQDQLKVAPENFQRRITLTAPDGNETVIFLGTSSGLRESHIRLDGEVETYTSRLNSFQVPVKRSDWIDKWQLSLEGIDRIEGNGVTLQKTADQWQLENVEYEASDTVTERITDLVESIQDMAVLDLAEPADDPALEWRAWTVQTGDQRYVYRIASDGKDHFAARDDVDFIFRINEGVYETLASADVATLLNGPAQTDSADDSPDPAGGPDNGG